MIVERKTEGIEDKESTEGGADKKSARPSAGESTEGFKVFGLYDSEGVEVKDPALKPYINLEPKLLLKSQGRNFGKFGKQKTHILERLANRVGVPGHIGKKHKIITSWASGKYSGNIRIVLKTFELIEKKTAGRKPAVPSAGESTEGKGENPIQVLVNAIENCAPRDEITVIEQGGARYPQAVDCSPLRRVDLTLRWLVQGSYQKAFGKKKKMAESLANEIILAADGNMEGYAMQKRNEAEKQADSAR
jgi:small subunit ribosomal protein S7